ncbi:MAG: hypothetical protein ACI4UE_07020 [Candidatus Scatovivens sp.]
MEEKLIKRKNLRIDKYDYSQEGHYFITICTKNRKEILGKLQNNTYVGADDPVRPKNNKIELTQIGKTIEICWKKIKEIYDNVETDQYIIMPNHIHGIIILKGRTESSAPTKNNTRI